MSLIEVNSLCKNYKIADKEQGLSGMLKHIVAPKYHMKEAVKDINFTVEKGESVAYIGSNGAGKSTTIKMLTGILKPSTVGRDAMYLILSQIVWCIVLYIVQVILWRCAIKKVVINGG